MYYYTGLVLTSKEKSLEPKITTYANKRLPKLKLMNDELFSTKKAVKSEYVVCIKNDFGKYAW